MMKRPINVINREPLKVIPTHLLQGVALVMLAHTRLELLLIELASDLLRIDYPLGRQILRGDNTREIFLAIIRLVDLWNVTPTEKLSLLRKAIESASARRNEVAHGVWVRVKPGDIRLRLVKGVRQTDVGPLDRRALPQFAQTASQAIEG